VRAAVVVLGGWGVAACGGALVETATELPTTPRRPDGVVLEPPPTIPPAVERAEARGIVTLREPLGEDALREVVRAYFTAFEREDAEALGQLLTPDAAGLDPRAKPATRAQLVDQFRARMRNLDYTKMAGTEVAELDRLEHFGADDLGHEGAPPRPSEMRADDVLVRVPVATPRFGGERFFGDRLTLLLRRDEGRLKIAGVAEDDAP